MPLEWATESTEAARTALLRLPSFSEPQRDIIKQPMGGRGWNKPLGQAKKGSRMKWQRMPRKADGPQSA
jgi:hypothetical protein